MEQSKERAEAALPEPESHGIDPADRRDLTRPRYGLLYGRLAAVALPLALIAGGVVWHYKSGGPPPASAEGKAAQESAAQGAGTPDPAAPPGVAVATESQMRQISVEPVAERHVDLERETTGRVGFNEDRITPVSANCAGRVVQVMVKKGDFVKAGQPMFELESPDVVAAENDLAAAVTAESTAAGAQEIARKAAERAKQLHEREAISTRELQEADAAYDRAQDDQHRARAAVRVAEAKLAMYGKTAEEVAQLGKLGQKNVGSVDDRVIIRAPISGTIVERKVGQGQYIHQDAADPLAMLCDLSSLWVQAEVYESFLSRIRVGAPVTINVAAYPDRKFPARVSFINPTVDPETRTVRVRCVVANGGMLLKPEMFARISIGASAPRPYPAVPASAVITQGADNFVFVEETPRHFRKRQVRPGQRVENDILVESGLNAGDRVATHGVLLLNGMLN
jgi:cobalt-zinc-cadmium efflux system membrane fusion protein